LELGKETVIESFPEEWSEEAEEKAPDDAARYRELQQRLADLNERRKAARLRLEQYKTAEKLLEPFHGEDAGLQDNIVTKNGHVEKELERMRMLMLRVERGMMGLGGEGGTDEMDIDVSDDKKRSALNLLV
jgi:Kinetochore complex Fta4 of Sim4 subunit, or CENP-50